MRKVLFGLIAILICSTANAQCVAEIKDVVIDQARGSIVVQTEYTLNEVVVQNGQTRYLETSGTNAEIIAKAKEDIETHCENLIRRIEKNVEFRNAESLNIQKALTTPIITAIKDDLVGEKKTVSEVEDTFKGKTIKVTADEKNTVSTIVAVEPK